MSWYRIVVGCMALSVTLWSQPLTKETETNQDKYIVEALLYDMYKMYPQSEEKFTSLYDKTKEKAYLFRAIRASLLGKQGLEENLKRLQAWDSAHPENFESKRLLISLYLMLQEKEKAKETALWLSQYATTPKDWEIISNVYLYTGEFEHALIWLHKIYGKTFSEPILFKIVKIMENYTHEHTQAIQLLETHYRMREVEDNELYFMLLALYSKDKNIEGLLSTYQALYAKHHKMAYAHKIVEIFVYQKRESEAIVFLEKNASESHWLFRLYKYEKLYDKAQSWVKKQYRKTQNPKWLAEEAMLNMENSKKHNLLSAMTESMALFDKAFSLGLEDALYWNYYGYTLIDEEIDIEKGIEFVKKALEKDAENSYYLDSLSWGYYKLHQCKKADEVMQKVVQKEGLDVKEIKEHYDAIKVCQ